jgi:hypothetical protein
LKAIELGGCEGGGSGVSGWECEDLCFCFVEEDTDGRAKTLKGFNENWEVFVREEGESVVEVCVCGAFRSATVVAVLVLCAAGLGSGTELVIDRAEDAVNDKAGKGRRKGISLGKAIFLDEEIEGAIRTVEEAFVGFCVHEIEVVYEGMEARVRFKDIAGFLSGHLVPAANQVNKDSSSVGREIGGQRLGDESVQLTVGGVDEEIKASADGQAKLAGRKQVFCKGVRVDEGKDGAGKTAPGSANADGAEFVKVGRILVKSKKATVCQEFGDSRGDIVVENESQNLGECFEAFLIF